MAEDRPTDAWQRATFAGAERETLLAGARLTFAQRLEWLEEASEIARRLAESRARKAGVAGRLPPTPDTDSRG